MSSAVNAGKKKLANILRQHSFFSKSNVDQTYLQDLQAFNSETFRNSHPFNYNDNITV